jgi:small multidrug resistance family-3 protein
VKTDLLPWVVFLAAALLEVGGDALIRLGMRGRGSLVVILGCLVLGAYGVMVNQVRWDFSKMLGVYVGVFAVVSVVFGRMVFGEVIPLTTGLGLLVIVVGGLIIQFGPGLW